MIDPMLSLTFSVHSNKGGYALLLGSGVSRSAEIPTGHEITLDLVRQLAVANRDLERCKPDPEKWYSENYGTSPDYSELLKALLKRPAERRQRLRSYFEPDEEDAELGRKSPKAAHQSIAGLVAAGFIRVIITTNFDRLLEEALAEVGIRPQQIYTPAAAAGSVPLALEKCTVIKVHGDYLDTRIKNTAEELSKYDRRLNKLLDRVLDEYGLIVCGWSALWDKALVEVLERCKTPRFSTYWALKSEPSDEAKRLIELRRAETIRITDADTFFQELSEKVNALEDVSKHHPLSPKLAVARLKTYIVDPKQRIRLYDLVMEEVGKVKSELNEKNFPRFHAVSPEELNARLEKYEAFSEILVHIMAAGCFWGEKRHDELWVKCIDLIARSHQATEGKELWLRLRCYPALLLLYVGGIAALAAQRYETLAALLTRTSVEYWNYDTEALEEGPAAILLDPWWIMPDEGQVMLSGREKQPTPLSNHLFDRLNQPLHEFLPDTIEYDKHFDRFEYFYGLVQTWLQLEWPDLGLRFEGRFVWKYRDNRRWKLMQEIEDEAQQAGESWPLLGTGLFDHSLNRFLEAKSIYDAWSQERRGRF